MKLITLVRPTGTTGQDPTRSWADDVPVRVTWLQMSGDRAQAMVGTYTDRLFEARFRKPVSLTRRVTSAWRVRDADSIVYEVVGVALNEGVYHLTVQLV
jgi:hypothetical protein